MKPFLLVSGDFVTSGGMDRANHALASYLARNGHCVHLVAHRAAPDLLAQPAVHLHAVPKPAGSYMLGSFWLDHRGRRCAASIVPEGGRVLVNGGNCQWGDVNWVHYVHAAYNPTRDQLARRWLGRARHHYCLKQERDALHRARLVIVNSEVTKTDVIERVGVAPERVHTVYYGTDPDALGPATPAEREEARQELGWPADVPVVVFIGALGDRRKGFDTFFDAWKRLCAGKTWDALLAVVGTGAEQPAWQQRAEAAGLADRICFLGFRRDVARILAASDVLVAPTRYEAYGLGVQEALCRGLPAFVSRSAGVAERYPPHLHHFLLEDPNDAAALAERLQHWRPRMENYRDATADFADQLRSHTWDHMAERIEHLVEETR
jgi:glycosyltransferase involved in cell wall biosynthesis